MPSRNFREVIPRRKALAEKSQGVRKRETKLFPKGEKQISFGRFAMGLVFFFPDGIRIFSFEFELLFLDEVISGVQNHLKG